MLGIICWVKGEDLTFSEVRQADVGNRDEENEWDLVVASTIRKLFQFALSDEKNTILKHLCILSV